MQEMNTGKENIADAGIADLSNTIRRRRMRLVNYDYRRSGAYFVTICTHDRACMFGTVVDGTMALNAAGALVQEEWRRLPERFPHIFLDAHVVMPNHMHGIIVVDTDSRAPTRGAPTLGEIVGAFKSTTTVLYARGVRRAGWLPFVGRLWQRSYYEHVIRNEASLGSIREYIVNNPQQWLLDSENPDCQTVPSRL